jgi:tetratricopeptide (TPR) repeat protein
MASAYERLQNYYEAISCYEKIIDIEPNNAKVYYIMGLIYIILDNTKEADRCFEKANELDPEIVEAEKCFVKVIKKAIEAYNNKVIEAYIKPKTYKDEVEASQESEEDREAIGWLKKAARMGDVDAQKWLRKNGYSW